MFLFLPNLILMTVSTYFSFFLLFLLPYFLASGHWLTPLLLLFSTFCQLKLTTILFYLSLSFRFLYFSFNSLSFSSLYYYKVDLSLYLLPYKNVNYLLLSMISLTSFPALLELLILLFALSLTSLSIFSLLPLLLGDQLRFQLSVSTPSLVLLIPPYYAYFWMFLPQMYTETVICENPNKLPWAKVQMSFHLMTFHTRKFT